MNYSQLRVVKQEEKDKKPLPGFDIFPIYREIRYGKKSLSLLTNFHREEGIIINCMSRDVTLCNAPFFHTCCWAINNYSDSAITIR